MIPTPAEKRREIARELVQREAVYPRLAAAGRPTHTAACRPSDGARAVLADYETEGGE